MTDITDDRLVLHPRHLICGDDAEISGGRDIDIAPAERVLDRQNAVALHGLQRADGIDFSHDDLSAHTTKRRRTALTDVTVATDHTDLTRDHDICRTLDAIEQRLAAAVEIIKLRLGDRVVHIDRWHEKLACVVHLVEAVHARRGLFRYALPLFHDLVPVVWLIGVDLLEKVFDHLLLETTRFGSTQSLPSSSS